MLTKGIQEHVDETDLWRRREVRVRMCRRRDDAVI
jgi:hypothetical protein